MVNNLLGNNDLLLNNIVEGILEKKGQEIVDLDLTDVQNAFCDHFIICHADSNTQVSAIADSVEKKVKEELNQTAGHREGLKNAMWILLEFNGIIVHVFQKEFRDFYRLEELWGDARILKIEESFI
ncbi:MAG: ribosome silencing factor [Bacteroidales bacterium]|nr:ribosome silencing factor [Bacteroidales bacterium]